MKRILINATHAEEIRVALCNGNHLYDFDLENRTREQKKANIYKGHVTRVEPSLEAVFVEYGSQRQGFLPIREIAPEYLSGDARSNSNIKQLIKEGDELIIQVEKEERGNKGAALSTFISLAGRYLVLMPNNPRGGGISRQISGKVREEMKQSLSELTLPKGMSVIIRTAGIGKTTDDLQHDLDHLLNIWQNIQQQCKKYPSPRLVHQEAGVVTRAVRDYLRDDITEIWVDNEYAYNEAANFIEAVMPQQLSKLRKYADYEPMFARFGIEKQIETAYQREVRLPSGGSIVIDQTEALVSIDINSSKATKGADVSETAFNTNLEAADEIARQLRLRDMGGLIVIDFIDMATDDHQKQVENRLKDATKNDRARLQFAEISRFGLLEMSRQRLRPSLEEATGYLCPRCHGTGMIRDLRSLALSIMRQIEQKALQERQGEIQVEVPTDIAAFLLNEKRETIVYLEQESGTRITVLPHAHLESPDFLLTYNRDGFAPSSYERIAESQQQENKDRGYDTTDWHTNEEDSPRFQRSNANGSNAWSSANNADLANSTSSPSTENLTVKAAPRNEVPAPLPQVQATPVDNSPAAVAWLSNLFAPTQQAQVAQTISSQEAAAAIESIVNTGAKSLGVQGQIVFPTMSQPVTIANAEATTPLTKSEFDTDKEELRKRPNRKSKIKKSKRYNENDTSDTNEKTNDEPQAKTDSLPKREPNSRREPRSEKSRRDTLVAPTLTEETSVKATNETSDSSLTSAPLENNESQRPTKERVKSEPSVKAEKSKPNNLDSVQIQVHKAEKLETQPSETIHLSLDNSKGEIVKVPETTEEVVSLGSEKVAEELPTFNIDTTAAVTPSDTLVQPQTNQLDVVPTQGRAKNDPREVYRAYTERFTSSTTTVVANLPINKITGTVKQFITEQLVDADTQLAEHGVVASFIKAVDAYQKTSATQTASASGDDNQTQFSQFFRNYGYTPVSQDSLKAYHQMITPANHFETAAGKTQVAPTPIKQRASNDPRGPLTAEQLTQTSFTFDNNEAVINQFVTSATAPSREVDIDTSPLVNTETSNDTIQNHYAQGTVGAWIVEKLGTTGSEMIHQGQLVSAYLQAHASNQSNQSVTDTNHRASTSQLAEATPQPQGESVGMQLDTSGVGQATPFYQQAEQELDAEGQPKKTTPASYKNMIESVAEQLKPTTVGMLTLATPKAPKTRTRKVKANDKPPVKPKTRTSKKVENAVVVTKNVKAESSESNVTTPVTDSVNSDNPSE